MFRIPGNLRRTPLNLKDKVADEIKELLEKDIIELPKVDTPTQYVDFVVLKRQSTTTLVKRRLNKTWLLINMPTEMVVTARIGSN